MSSGTDIVSGALLAFAQKSTAANKIQIVWRLWRNKYPRQPNVGNNVIRIQGHRMLEGLKWEFYGYHNGKKWVRVLTMNMEGMNVLPKEEVFEDEEKAKEIQGKAPEGPSTSETWEEKDFSGEKPLPTHDLPPPLEEIKEEEGEDLEIIIDDDP